MERDLHDGAQQRLLALTYDLRVALTIAESTGNVRAATPLRSALDRALAASQELREVAHGIFPAELATSGLAAALESLADVGPLRLEVELPAGRRYRSEIETAAYAVVVEAVDAADGTVVAVLSEQDGSLRLAVDGVDTWAERLVHVEDRVGAAGGELTVEPGRLDVVLPCG
jgi:signal transduction histidine kinase